MRGTRPCLLPVNEAGPMPCLADEARSFPDWPIIGLSFYVANMSGSTFVALPGSGYNDGIAVYNYEWLPALLLVFFALFILPLLLRAQVYTAPQFLEHRFGRSA